MYPTSELRSTRSTLRRRPARRSGPPAERRRPADKAPAYAARWAQLRCEQTLLIFLAMLSYDVLLRSEATKNLNVGRVVLNLFGGLFADRLDKTGFTRRNPLDCAFPYHDDRCMATT